MREFGITIGFVNLICISFVFIKLILTFLYPSVFFVVVSKSLLRSRKNNSYFRLKFCSDAEARMLIKFENRLDEIDITIAATAIATNTSSKVKPNILFT